MTRVSTVCDIIQNLEQRHEIYLNFGNWYETRWPHGETQVREVWVLDFWLSSLAMY